ncbi:type II secretion system protein GspM [Paucibacter sp. AS339]|uniref:type II secretion system protein GspM n=1 Tax=Paucibacter hankyongi TaxID=3133434 RepID=UPI0030B3928A
MSQAKIANWQALKTQAQTQWAGLGERERLSLQLVAWVLGALLIWLLAVQPGLRVLRQAPGQLQTLEAQLQDMQALALEVRELRATPAVPAALAVQALQAASEHLGPGAKLSLNGDRAILNLNGIGAEALQAWLGEVRSAARAKPLEAKLQRGPNGYSGSIVLSLSGATP